MARFVRTIEVTGAVVLTVLMGGVFVGGIKKISVGVWELVILDQSAAGVASLLKGIEYFFLAPLLPLAFVSMVLFVRGFFRAIATTGSSAGASQPAPPHSRLVFAVKESMAALMIAILLTNIVDHALADTVSNWLSLSANCLGVVLSGGYLLVLTYAARHA